MNKKRRKSLSIRERKFIKALVAGKTPTQAMRDAGYAESTALSKQSEKVGKLAVPIQGLMERMGITDELLLQVLAEGLQATKRIYLRNWRRRKEEVSTLKNELCNAVTRTKKG